ncbi:MAG: bifunctional enoyl-CoA hydratase/phosphate acetyltransferase [Eubacteriales bacterium]|nr:bifunctional enoyl-CoA hydratase/phosphate acetyltransferase [Eubacteriales bacterium]
MVYQNFDEIISSVQNAKCIKRAAIVMAQDEHTLEAVFQTKKDGIVEPILIGGAEEITYLLEKIGVNAKENLIIEAKNEEEAALIAVTLIHTNKADFIMKGKIQTADLLKPIVDKRTGLHTGKVMSHMAIHEIPGYHKLLAVTDGGMMITPNLSDKRHIIENAVNCFLNMGYDEPKVAILAAIENVNPKMIETVDANSLKEMNFKGEIRDCIIEGPISYDLVMSKESAKIKGYQSKISGEADILVVPNIATGNILGKALVYSAGAKMAGLVLGAKVPIVLTSRGASSEEKYRSILLASRIAK